MTQTLEAAGYGDDDRRRPEIFEAMQPEGVIALRGIPDAAMVRQQLAWANLGNVGARSFPPVP